MENGDYRGSQWISIWRDRPENLKSLGHTNLYPESAFRNSTTHLTLAYIIIGDATVASPRFSKYAF